MTDDERVSQLQYSTTVTADRCVVSLWERPKLPDARSMTVSVDGHKVGELGLNPWETPSIGVGDYHVVIWMVKNLYVIRRDTHSLTVFKQSDQVNEAYPIDHQWWCLVRELSVVIADLDRHLIEEVFEHNEVIVASWWEGNRLYVEDFQQRRFAFELSSAVPLLKQVDITAE